MQRLKLGLRRLFNRELRYKPRAPHGLVTVGDWSFLPKRLNQNAIVYSFGIGDDISFDCCIAGKTQCQVHAFDPTIDLENFTTALPTELDISAYRYAVAGKDSSLTLYERLRKDGRRSGMYTLDQQNANGGKSIEVPALTVKSVMQKLGHTRIDVAKFDVEGAEYAAIDQMLNDHIYPNQLLIEYHHRFPSCTLQDTRNQVNRLLSLGYALMAVSATGRELAFCR